MNPSVSRNRFCWPGNANSPQSANRRGVMLLATVICLAVVTTISGVIIQGMIIRHRQSRSEQDQLQALWLTESAAQRALSRLMETDYQGETWRIPANQIDRKHAGQVIIKVTRMETDHGVAIVDVQADLVAGKVDRVRHSRRFQFSVASAGEAP